MTAPWSQTFSGRAFPMEDPDPSDVHWPDIIYGLAHINRFCGQAGPYSVAQHSVLVADQLPADMRLYGLLHDAHEAYIGDTSTPVKRALGIRNRLSLWSLADSVDRAIYLAAGLAYPVPETIAEAVHIADMRALMTERRDLMKAPPKSWGAEYEALVPLPDRIRPWSPQQAIARFAGALSDAGLPVASLSFVG